jgi:hypothetical protein
MTNFGVRRLVAALICDALAPQLRQAFRTVATSRDLRKRPQVAALQMSRSPGCHEQHAWR